MLRTGFRRGFVPNALAMAGCVAMFVAACTGLRAQFAAKPAIGAADVAEEKEEDTRLSEEDLGERFVNGASLKTDAELEKLLKVAERFVNERRFDLASTLWQKVLDESGDTLMLYRRPTDENELPFYTSLSAEIERTLSKLPPEGLKLYRISADGEASAILATIERGANEEEALTRVVRRYFMSSLGDDAAYKLGCLALDRHDFVGAARMFQAILDQHPDPSMPQADVLLRMAIASAKVGDMKVAEQALKDIETADGARPSRDTLTAVREFVASASAGSSQAASSGHWPLEYGNPARTGTMKALPKGATEADLAELWSQEFDVLLPQVLDNPQYQNASAVRGVRVLGGGIAASGRIYGRNVQPPSPESRTGLVDRWHSEKWFPTARLLFDGEGLVYVKTATHLAAYDANALSDEPVWKTAWYNMYQLDAGLAYMQMMSRNYGQNFQQEGPRTPAEALHFGDRIHSSMSMSNGLIFNLEGKQVGKLGGPVEPDEPPQNRGHGYVPRRSRKNWLAAYEARTGKAVWYRSADDEEKNGKTNDEIGFMAGPTPYGNLLLVPVSDGGTIWLYALNAPDGKTVWKSYLCDEPQGGTNQWATVGVAIDGRDAYVCCGTGALFAVDAVSGTIRWAVRYPRTGKPNHQLRNIGVQQAMLDLDGWQDDYVIPYGKLLVAMPSDYDQIFAIDRRTGEFAWRSPRTPESNDRAGVYPLGVQGRSLFVAGRDVVRKYDIPSGRLVQELNLDDNSYGRGCLTEDAIYLPVKDSVLKLSLENLSEISQVGVSSVARDYVGNLFSDGDKLWVAGASRVYALTNFDRRMQELATRIERGDAAAQLIRMRMQGSRGHLEEALADLEGAFAKFQTDDPLDAARIMVDGIRELGLAQVDPVAALRLLSLAFLTEEGQPRQFSPSEPTPDMLAVQKDVLSTRAELTYASLSNIRLKKVSGAPEMILRVAPYFDQEYLIHAARKTISSVAEASDVEALAAGVSSSEPNKVLIAADALAALKKEEAEEPLKKLLESEREAIRLAGARALLNLGKKDSLPVLVGLLEAEDTKVASQSSSLLRHAAGKQVAFSASDEKLRKEAVATWKEWLDKESADAKLNFPLPEGEPMLGRTLVCMYAQGRVIEYDEKNEVRWSKQVQGVWGGQGLPNGHRLLSLYAMRKIVELDEKGDEVWSLEGLPGSPFNVRRLANGNTLVACSDSQLVIEYNHAKEKVWELTAQGRPMDAVRLENGNTLVALAQGSRVAEFDKDKQEVWSCDELPGAMSVERLENGNTLVACMNGGAGRGMVVEIDPNKKHVWKFENVQNPYDAQRLPNGNTLITDNQQVQEIAEVSKPPVWSVKQSGSSSAHRY